MSAWEVMSQIARSCELSCDEAVIKNFDTDGKQSYGDTLITMAADTKKPKIIVSTTMCEEKKALKERLGASMPKESTTSVEILIDEFEKEEFEVKLVEFQNSRSENLSYLQRPEILLVNGEEIFVFQYSSRKAVIDDLKLTSDFDKKSTYYNDVNIFLYRGDNDTIIELLKNKLSVLENYT